MSEDLELLRRDPLGVRFVLALRERARALGGGAAAILLRRAEAELVRIQRHCSAPPRPPRLEPQTRAAWDERLAERARERGARGASSDLMRELFRDSVGDARAALVVARARDGVADAAGPYNGRAVAAELLDELARLSPSYLRALLTWLDDLAALEALPPEPPRARRSR